jgi:hypothetical protein
MTRAYVIRVSFVDRAARSAYSLVGSSFVFHQIRLPNKVAVQLGTYVRVQKHSNDPHITTPLGIVELKGFSARR